MLSLKSYFLLSGNLIPFFSIYRSQEKKKNVYYIWHNLKIKNTNVQSCVIFPPGRTKVTWKLKNRFPSINLENLKTPYDHYEYIQTSFVLTQIKKHTFTHFCFSIWGFPNPYLKICLLFPSLRNWKGSVISEVLTHVWNFETLANDMAVNVKFSILLRVFSKNFFNKFLLKEEGNQQAKLPWEVLQNKTKIKPLRQSKT